MPQPAISVVVPAYNEAAGIVPTVEAIASHLGTLGRSYELLLVDNASTDGTAELVERIGDERIRVLINDSNRGKGFSVRRGMLAVPPAPGTRPSPSSGSEITVAAWATTWPASAGTSMPAPMHAP